LGSVILTLVACTGPSDTATTPTGSGATPTTSGSTETPATAEPGEVGELSCWSNSELGGDTEARFEDVTGIYGLIEPLVGMHGHVAAFGDPNSDNQPDLMVGTFADREPEAYQVREAEGPSPDQLLLSPGPAPEEGWSDELGRSSGAVFADFDLDGDDDLLLVRHAGRDGDYPVPSRLFENVDGTLTSHSEPLPADFRGRTPAVADFDGDGLLDLYVSEDNSGETGGLLLRNTGSLAFENVTGGSGLEGVLALSATAGHIDSDLRPDLATSTAVFLNQGAMKFLDITPEGYQAEPIGDEDDAAGVAIGDLNRDTITDLVVGQHYRATVEFASEVPVRLFLGDGEDQPRFEEVTGSAGLTPLPTLAPHVDIADMDNDGWPDIVTTASAENGTAPAVYRNSGETPLRFEEPPGLGSDQYWIGGPVTDFDHDGRLDLFAVEWEPALPSILFRNRGASGHWLEVSIGEPGDGVGSVVMVSNLAGDMIGSQEIGVGGGYSSGRLPVAHFGLGAETEVDVAITTRDGTTTELSGVVADQHIRWPKGC
jgi:enediyne biosynthesis protein E4